MQEITLFVNGTEHRIDTDPATPLLFVLRNNLGLTGAKLGCGLEQCGACAVLVDGVSTLCCAVAASDFQGKEIVTVEGLAGNGEGNDVQRAFTAAGAAQCGYCTPGIVIAATALLRNTPKPDDARIREALMPHLCRCGSQPRILRALKQLIEAA
ncbi:MAG: (2Fe-2S)-binding protein [Alphaproteobacteria bacterium]|nr:MAG: (2Fe-2S)-binding protein [Alphaproteobacteria bacterium]